MEGGGLDIRGGVEFLEGLPSSGWPPSSAVFSPCRCIFVLYITVYVCIYSCMYGLYVFI